VVEMLLKTLAIPLPVFILLGITDNTSFANPALDIRLERGWQVHSKTGKTSLETENVEENFKKTLDEYTEKIDKKQRKENPIWETTSATVSFYPHQPLPLALSLRLASIPARRTILEQDSDKRFDLGIQAGNPHNGFYGGIYAKVYEAFSYQLDDDEEELTIGNKTLTQEFSYDLDSIRVEGEVGIRSPIFKRIYGSASVNTGYYEITSRTEYKSSVTEKTTSEKGEEMIKKISEEEESWSRTTTYLTFSFALGLGFVIGEKNKQTPTNTKGQFPRIQKGVKTHPKQSTYQ